MMVAVVNRDGVSYAPGSTKYFMTGDDLHRLMKESTARTGLLDLLKVNQVCVAPLGILKGDCYRDVTPKSLKLANTPSLDYFARA